MSDAPAEETKRRSGARMHLDPETIHEGDDGAYLDCPQCGSNVSLTQIITEGRCSGHLEGEVTETEDDIQKQDCTAKLSLELVWED